MPNSKVQLANGTVLIDLTGDTVDASTLKRGFTAHDKAGNAITGTMDGGLGGAYNVVSTSNADGTQNLAITDAEGAIIIEPLSITTNGTYTAAAGKAYSPVSVNVPTGAARSSSDLTVSGAIVNVPAGLYSEAASKSVASGSAGTPTATKGTVSNHAVTVTPSVTNTTGYITGGTKTGSAVSVSASELVSGSETKTANGTYDVTNLASLVVSIPTYDGTVS